MEIFVAIKMLTSICFGILALYSIVREKHRYVLVLTVIALVCINFWVCAKLGEDPNVSAYIVGLLTYILAIIIVVLRKMEKVTKPIGYYRSDYDKGWD